MLAAFVALGGISWFNGKDRVPWRTNWQAAQTEALSAHKPIFLDFSAQWCDPCQEMRRQTWSRQSVADSITSRYIPVHIDIDEHPEIAKQYGVESIPWYGVIDNQGQAIKSSSGLMDADEFITWLNG